jgi:hypothetical protein
LYQSNKIRLAKTNNGFTGEITMKKSRLLGVVCASLFAFCLSTSTHAAFLVSVLSGDNGVSIGSASGLGLIEVHVDFVNLDPVWLVFDSRGSPSEQMTFRFNNLTGLDWTDFHIEFASNDPSAPVSFNVPVIAPDTNPNYILDVGFNENTALPDAAWIFFNTPEGLGLSVNAFTDAGVAQFSLQFQPTVVPVPAAVWLFASGLLGLIGIARRKKA